MITTTCFGLFRPSSGLHPKAFVFIRFIRLCNDGEISSSGEHCTPSQHNTHITEHPPPSQPRLLIVVIIKTTDDEISPSLHNRINLINTNTLLDENMMMAGIGRNM